MSKPRESKTHAAQMRAQRAEQDASAAAASLLVDIGQPVTVERDNGDLLLTRIRQLPWQTDSGNWLVSVHGISGGYSCRRVTPRDW